MCLVTCSHICQTFFDDCSSFFLFFLKESVGKWRFSFYLYLTPSSVSYAFSFCHLVIFVYVHVLLMETCTVLCHLDQPLPDNRKRKPIFSIACPNFTPPHLVSHYFCCMILFILPLVV